jgi:hypothetical protein
MAEMTPEDSPEDTRDLMHRNIRKTVAVSGLRKIRGVVDEYDEERRLNERLSRRMLTAGALVAGLLTVTILLSGGALPRFITAALAWFKG